MHSCPQMSKKTNQQSLIWTITLLILVLVWYYAQLCNYGLTGMDGDAGFSVNSRKRRIAFLIPD